MRAAIWIRFAYLAQLIVELDTVVEFAEYRDRDHEFRPVERPSESQGKTSRSTFAGKSRSVVEPTSGR
jgi:hypothetical protein